MTSEQDRTGGRQALDPFAEIALREHPLAKDGMAEIKPRERETRMFLPGEERAARPSEPAFEERLAAFGQELAELRERYRPYLRRKSPPAARHRRRLELNTFDFRYENGESGEFARVLRGEGEWERITIPDFRGPTKEEGRWTGYYRSNFPYAKPSAGKRVYLVFKGVDYKASVYVNGKCAGMHEGFFAPFEFDVTPLLAESNALVVEVRNDYPMMGVNGTRLDGDKMYAATGPGWDEPVWGWHHCPPGAGIYNKVYLEERAELFVGDIFVRPMPEEGAFEAWIDVENATDGLIEGAELAIDVFADNFEGEGLAGIRFPIAYAGPGMNNYRYKIAFPHFRFWDPESPCMYRLRASLRAGDSLLDTKDRCFGMRSFRMDEETVPKGSLYLNGRPIVLRGANEMGHLQQCVMQGDEAQLVDDILIAKLANLNFYRITQRPVQEEIYDCMDRLGMLSQCDLPAFGFIRRSRFCEAVRQAAEMERLVRSHPSVIMASLINEPSRPAKRGKGHRHLYRGELEAFFASARHAIAIENPDRVVKNADGDYDPPTAEGLSDFHCYTMWYTNHMIPFGEFYKGGLPPLKKDWKTGCGEYGSEGLDRLALMRERYPREWLPDRPDDSWMPDAIVDSQTYSHHGDWYPEADRIGDWIDRSQRYQAFVTKLMTDAIRRRADLIAQSAIHLLIDAWPSGWMKALVGADRVPKPAYFAYRDSLKPLRVHLRGDRWRAYAGETVELEAWLLNDSPVERGSLRLVATLRDDREDYASFQLEGMVGATTSAYAGSLPLVMPDVAGRRAVNADISLYDDAGRLIDGERFGIEVFAKPARPFAAEAAKVKAVYLGKAAEALCDDLGLACRRYEAGRPFDVLTLSSAEAFRPHEAELADRIAAGARAIVLPDEGGEAEWRIGGVAARQEKAPGLYALAVAETDPRAARFGASDFQFFYNGKTDRIDALTGCGWRSETMAPLLYTYEKPARGTASGGARKRRIPAVGSVRLGSGELIFSGLRLEGRVGFNPPLDLLLQALIAGSRDGGEA